MSIEGRLDRLTPALTAKERAILVLRAWKEGGEEDLQVRWRMPPGQAREFNGYISLMNSVNSRLGVYVGLLQQLIARLDLRHLWLITLHLWALSTARLSSYIALCSKEPVTESEHHRLVKEARAEMVPASELAETWVERYDGWADADLDPNDGGVSDAAWKRVLAEKEREIGKLAKAGKLVSERKGRRLLVNAGSFYDWIGEAVPVVPDLGSDFELFPDERADEVRWLQAERRQAQEALLDAPLRLVMGEPQRTVRQTRDSLKEGISGDEIAEALLATLQEDLQARWQELRAVEILLEEVAAEFDGEDLSHPEVRRALEESKLQVEELHRNLQSYVEPFALPEPNKELLDEVKEIMQLGLEPQV